MWVWLKDLLLDTVSLKASLHIVDTLSFFIVPKQL